jgi:hypothetical protein
MYKHLTLKAFVVLGCVLLFIMNASAAILSYNGEGNPILGASIIATGGDVIATFVPIQSYVAYDNYLYLASPANPYQNMSSGIGPNYIFQNHLSSPGAQVDLGTFPAGTELIFNILANTHGGDNSQGSQGYLNWYTGPGSRNADGKAHAFVDASYTGPYGGTFVGWEDLTNLGDAGYEDLYYTFTNVQAGPPGPEGEVPLPATIILLGSALLGLMALRQWRFIHA